MSNLKCQMEKIPVISKTHYEESVTDVLCLGPDPIEIRSYK